MSDDLITRLRYENYCETECPTKEAADRIEQLERERDKFEALAIMNLQENGTHICRAEIAEAKLAKAVEALRKIKQFQSHSNFILVRFASEALAELEK